MKAFLIGADSVAPEYIYKNPELYPNLKKLIESGMSTSYSAYVKKGYNRAYTSEVNWSSIYTGLEPDKHKIIAKYINDQRVIPDMSSFKDFSPFWEVLNNNNLSVGLWIPDCCKEPVEIKGYTVSINYISIETPVNERRVERQIQVCNKDVHILQYLNGNPPPCLYPKTLAQQGYSFKQLQNNSELAWGAVEKYHFEESLENYRKELDYFFNGMKNTQMNYPVDVMCFFTPTPDIIAHSCMYCNDNETLIKAYQITDEYVGKFIEEFKPEITVFLSDHGQRNFNESVKCSDPVLMREAYGVRDNVIWLKNGYIAFEGYNGALLFSTHSLFGTFIASGKGIKHTKVKGMRTIDIYPALLEMLGVKIPPGKNGYVPDMFDRELVNADKLFPADKPVKSIALIQCQSLYGAELIVNELYLENRFAEITIVGEEKYSEIFLNNPRVSHFVSYDNFDRNGFDEVYCGVYNEPTGFMRHMKI